MDGSNSTDHDTPPRDLLLYHNGHAYSLLAEPQGGCYRAQKLGTRENYRAFLENIVRDLAMRHRLWLQALYWAAYFGEGVGHDFMGWLTEALFTGRLGLYEVVCSGPPRGEPKKPDEKQVRAAVSAGLDNTPWVAPIKSALQMVTGVDVVTDAPVSRWGEAAGIALGVIPGGKLIAKAVGKGMSKNASKALGETTSQKKAQGLIGEARDSRFTPRTPGPDDMTNTKALTEWESKVTKDNRVRVAKNKQQHKQGSPEKNEAYAEKMLSQRKKVGKATDIVGGPLTAQEMDLWQEVADNGGRKQHMLVHTNSETGVVRVFKQDERGNFDPKKPINQFELDDFAAIKKKLMEDYP